MSDKITFMTQEDLLAQIHKDRASFAAIWENLTNEQMIQVSGPQDDWSVKDLIAHIVWWENFMIGRVKDRLSGGEGKRTESIDSLNARIFEENKDRNLADILSEFALNLSKIEALVANLNNEQINDTNVINIKGEALLQYLTEDTFGHYDMHRDDLQNFVNSLA
jgi:hypothetical protein